MEITLTVVDGELRTEGRKVLRCVVYLKCERKLMNKSIGYVTAD